MILRMPLLCLRMLATFLVVLGLMASAQVKAAMPFSGPLMAVEICHDDQTLTIWLDAEGNEHPAPHDCQECGFCGFTAPVLPAFIAGLPLLTPAHRMAAVPRNSFGALRPDYLTPPLRGPPTHHNRIASA